MKPEIANQIKQTFNMDYFQDASYIAGHLTITTKQADYGEISDFESCYGFSLRKIRLNPSKTALDLIFQDHAY